MAVVDRPDLRPPGRRYSFGWGSSSRKLTGPAIAAADLGPIDAVLLSHDHHGDNLDTTGRALLPGASVVLTTTDGARRLGGNARGLQPWATTRLEAPGRPAIQVTATPCRHGPPLSRPIAGEVIGFALGWEGQAHGVLWITGDTVLYDGVRQVADRLQVDTALLHLGCVRFPVTGPIRYTMTAQEAVELCRLVRPRTAIPVHYEGWTHFHQDRPAIVAEFAQAPADIGRRLQWLPFGAPSASRGEHTRLAPGRPVSERLTSPLTVDGDPATTLLGTAVSRNLLAQRKPGIQLSSPPPQTLQVRASPALSGRPRR